MTISQTSCGDAMPFIRLGNGDSAPTLNYNLPQKTCYRGNGYFPIAVEESFFDPAILNPDPGSPWAIASQMNGDQIESTLREDLLRGQGAKLILNTHLLKYHPYLIRLLKHAAGSPIMDDPKPETMVVGDSNMRVSQLPNSTSHSIAGPPLKRVNHLAVLPDHPADRILLAGYSLAYIVEQVQNGYIPQLYTGFGGRVRLRFLLQAPVQPRLTLVEHYKVCAYLGDYGAGKTVRTFSLLPGEQTTISVQSYKDKTSSYTKSSTTNSNEYSSTYYQDDETSTSVKSENILDSFSQYSADQLQSQIESIEGTSTGEQSGSYETVEEGSGKGRGGGFNLLGLVNWQGGSSSQSTIGSGSSTNSIREDHISTLESALEATVTESGQYRDVEVNTTTGNSQNQTTGGAAGSSNSISVSEQEQMMVRTGESTTTIRHLRNINQSRTLNFVFRQLLQEYVVLTYLDDVSVVFSTGQAGQTRSVRIGQLYGFLQSIMPQKSHVEQVFHSVLLHLCNVTNYQGVKHSFAEKVDETLDDCFGGGTPVDISYWRKRAGLSDSYSSGGQQISVPGVIVSANSHILRTDSVIVDSVLGQGEALDCYNQRLQEASAQAAELRNARMEQNTGLEKDKTDLALAAIAKISDPVQQAEAYEKIFGTCCPATIQTQTQS